MWFFLITYITLVNQPDVEISAAPGLESELPANFVSLNEIEYLEIRSSYWAKVEINISERGTYILQGGKPNLTVVQFYNDQHQLIGTGNHIKINPTSRQLTYYLYYPFVDEKDKNLLSIDLVSEISFLKKRNEERIYQFAFHSFLLFPLLVAIVLALRTRELVYAWYALYILAIMGFFGYQYGLLGEIFPIVNRIPPMWIWFFSFLNATFYLLFSSSFLDLKRFDPFSGKLIFIAQWFIIGFFLVSVVLYLLNIDVQHSLAYKLPFISLEAILIVWFIKRIFKHPSRIKKYYLAGFFILILEAIAGQTLSTNQNAADFNHLFQLGMVVEVFILALGLSVRIDETQKEKNKVQSDLIGQLKVNEELQLKYTNELKEEVFNRTEALTQRNQENEVLLKEVHHRVKNNLQMITSILSMQQRRLSEKAARDALALTKNRVKSIGLIHEHLYRHDDFSKINLEEYVEELVFILIDSLYRGTQKVKSQISVKNIEAEIETAIPIGLILNELITNSIKYAFNNHPDPCLMIQLDVIHDELMLDVIDNGTGIKGPADAGFGNIIVNTLIESHNGDLTYPDIDNGFHVRATIRDFKIADPASSMHVHS